MGNKLNSNILSKEGEEFILNLNVYLMSTGKSDKEIKEFIYDAEQHLILGEKEGKTVKDIFGDSPEEYAKSVATEMDFNKKEIASCILILIVGFGTWMFFSNISNKEVSFSYFELISIPIVYILTIGGLLAINKKFAFKSKVHAFILFLLFSINMASIVCIDLVSKNMPHVFTLNQITVNVVIIALFIVSTYISYKIETYILMLPFIFHWPEMISNFTNITLNVDSVYLLIISIILCAVFSKFEMNRITKNI